MKKGLVILMMLFISTVAIAADDYIRVDISPNPANSQISISCKGVEGSMKVELISVLGSKLLEKTFEGNDGYLEVSSIPDGVYLIRTTIGTETAVKRVKIQH